MPLNRVLAALLVSGVLFTGISSSAPLPDDRNTPRAFRLESSSSTGLIVTFAPRSYREDSLLINGRRYSIWNGTEGGSTDEPGKPLLPTDGFLFALPPDATPVIEILESKFEEDSNIEVAPAPSFTTNSEGEAVARYLIDQDFYSRHNTWYPSAVASPGSVGMIRHQRCGTVLVHPFQYDPSRKILRRLVHLKLGITFMTGRAGTTMGDWQNISGQDPFFERSYSGLIINHQDARNWRGRRVPAGTPPASDTGAGWFDPAREYIRLSVDHDSMYHLTYADLANGGMYLDQIDRSTLALYDQGRSIPFLLSTTDSEPQNWFLEFHGQRKRGAGSTNDEYTDTSAYWLTWNDPLPARFETTGVPAGEPDDTTTWHTQTLHVEQDNTYFFGVTQDEIQDPRKVPGEGWFMVDFVSGTSRTISFTIDSVNRGTGTPVELRARFHGMTLCQSTSCRAPSRHSADIRLNGIVVGSINWTDNTEALFSASVPDSILHTGSNALQIVSRTWTSQDSNITRFYLDWYEVDYPRPLRLTSSLLTIRKQSTAPGIHAYRIDGIESDSLLVLDVTNNRLLNALSPGGAGRSYFLDTVTASCEYLVIRHGSGAVPGIEYRKRFRDLRNLPGGADYLIVTHTLFAQEAERLGQHRATTNTVRSAVVDIQDIYDEFNFGNPDPEALKRFLRYAYDNWPSPSPSYLVLFGDASWDSKRLMTSSVKSNFVPSYGNPPSDNALVAFDSVQYYLPSMIVGRLPVETPSQASLVVSKIIGYDSPPLSAWNKSFLLITGGDTPTEKTTFNFWSNGFINSYIKPPPLGGKASTVYKTTDAIIDGENKPLLQSIVNDGVVFLNFIGHSGGRIWSVDIGKPEELENTTGKLPFVSSVSCNVGFFSDPRANVLAEDFLLADNRGAIGVWAGSSIGYGSVGRALVDYLLMYVTADSLRMLGDLTNLARLRYWSLNSLSPLVIQTLELHPLIGDPMSGLAIPLKPDFAVTADDIRVQENPPTADSSITLRVSLSNFGLMAGRTVPVELTDGFAPEERKLASVRTFIPPVEIPDFGMRDSFSVNIDVRGKPGDHLIGVRIDPADSIGEMTASNNFAEKSFYVYRHTISAVAPVPFSVIRESAPLLTVTIPAGNDTTSITYAFQVDTVNNFSSGFLLTSPEISPGPVSASWQTPSLPDGKTYHWRSRTFDGAKYGAWRTSSFSIEPAGGNSDTTIWRQRGRSQMGSNTGSGISVTDSGVTLVLQDSARLHVRSVGTRYNQTAEYYSIIRINTATAVGYWWQNAYSYLAGRYNPADGTYILKGFDLLRAGSADSLSAFLTQTPTGSIILLSVVLNGKQNMTETLYQLIEQLGGSSVRSIQAGQSWALIARKGDGVAIFESYQPAGIAEGDVTIGNTYNHNSGSLLSGPIGPSNGWISGTWDVGLPGPSATATLKVLGIRTDAGVDTLLSATSTMTTFDLSGIDSHQYPFLRFYAGFANSDGSTTPLLRSWGLTYTPPPDLAISPRTFTTGAESVNVNTPLEVTLGIHNIGSRSSAGWIASIFFADDTTRRIDTTFGALAPGSAVSITPHIVAGSTSGVKTLVANVTPASPSNDLLPENNIAFRTVMVTDVVAVSEISILADGRPIRRGDYLPSSPAITIEVPAYQSNLGFDPSTLPVTIDGAVLGAEPASEFAPGTVLYKPVLGDGEHLLEVFSGIERLPSQVLFRAEFTVSATARILNPFAYPNPFSSATSFTFKLTGARAPDELDIKVYTLAGRMIRHLAVDPSGLRIGFNIIPWDGRDEAGDEIANGTYLYRVTVREGNQSATEMQRLTKLR